jgi:hypothetical protein
MENFDSLQIFQKLTNENTIKEENSNHLANRLKNAIIP